MLNLPRNKTISGLIKSGMPQMDSTLTGWEVPLTLIKLTQSTDEGDLVTSETRITFKGVWQPLSSERLELKPDGQRSWEWVWIHARSRSLNLETADKILFNNRKYKVMSKKDYGLNSFVEYELVRDYEDGEISENDN